MNPPSRRQRDVRMRRQAPVTAKTLGVGRKRSEARLGFLRSCPGLHFTSTTIPRWSTSPVAASTWTLPTTPVRRATDPRARIMGPSHPRIRTRSLLRRASVRPRARAAPRLVDAPNPTLRSLRTTRNGSPSPRSHSRVPSVLPSSTRMTS